MDYNDIGLLVSVIVTSLFLVCGQMFSLKDSKMGEGWYWKWKRKHHGL